jgi:hypothetical protein
MYHPPTYDFQPYTPARTDTIRQAREAMWRRQLEAGVKKRSIKHKADDSADEPSTKKRTTRTKHPTPIPANIPPHLDQLLAQTLKTKGF